METASRECENRQSLGLPITTYYVRSSVLGGQVVTELNTSGINSGTHKTHLFVNGQEIAVYDSWVNQVISRLSNPVTGSGWKELDPLGGLVGFADPFVQNPNTTYDSMHANEALYLEDGNPFDPGGGCTLDGLPVSCEYAAGRVASGAAAVTPMRDAVPVWYRGELTLAFFQAFADGYQGYVPGNATYAGAGHIKSINPPKLIRTGYHPNTNLAALNGASSSDDPEVVLAQSTGQPQNSFPTFSKDNLKMVNDSIKLAQEMTDPKNNKECDEALEAYGIPSLAALINGLTPNGNVFDGRTSTLAGPIGKNGMTESIAAYFKENKTSVGATVFPNSVTGRGSVTFLGDYFFNPPSIAWVAQQRAIIMLHEAVHQVGGKGDAAFGSSKQLSEKIIEKCYPVLKGKLGGVG